MEEGEERGGGEVLWGGDFESTCSFWESMFCSDGYKRSGSLSVVPPYKHAGPSACL